MTKKREKFPEGIEFKQVKRTVKVRTILEPEEKVLTLFGTLNNYAVNSLFTFLGVAIGSGPSALSGDGLSSTIFWVSITVIIVSVILLIFLHNAKNSMNEDS